MVRTEVQNEIGQRRKEGENAVQPDMRHQCDFIEKGHPKVVQKTEAMSQMFTKEDFDTKPAINKKTQKNLIPVLPPRKQNTIPLIKSLNEIGN